MNWTTITRWIKQPSTLMAGGLLIGGAVYWQTKSPELALAAAAVLPGAVNDHTSAVLTKIEGLEDAVRPIAVNTAVTAAAVAPVAAKATL